MHWKIPKCFIQCIETFISSSSEIIIIGNNDICNNKSIQKQAKGYQISVVFNIGVTK